MNLKKIIVAISVNINVLRELQQRPHADRLGTLVTIKLNPIVKDNPEYFSGKVLQFLIHIFATLDFQIPRNLDFGEMCDCWVKYDDEFVITVRHKYWSHAQVVAFFSVLEAYAKLYEWGYDI